MAFFVLEKDVTSGSLRLPIDGQFVSREEALGALSAAVAAGEASVAGQVYVVDLESALPVLVMSAPAPAVAPPVDALAAEAVDEVSTEATDVVPAGVTDEVPAEVPAEASEPLEASALADESAAGHAPADSDIDGIFGGAIAGASLADALKRAANSLEEEGIVAPESIDAEDFSFEEDLVMTSEAGAEAVEATALEDVAASPVSMLPEPAVSSIVEPMSTQADTSPEVLEAPADWPWANVEAFTEPDAGEPDEAGDVAAVFDEPDTLITSAPPLGEDAYVPRPVILGDYSSVGEADADAAAGERAPEPEVPAEDLSTAVSAATLEDQAPEAGVAPEQRPESAPANEMAYEPTGELDLSAYTCNDCVYANTCPKVGEVTPADCGTFQWRAS